jgi:hypothetical protein
MCMEDYTIKCWLLVMVLCSDPSEHPYTARSIIGHSNNDWSRPQPMTSECDLDLTLPN